MCVFFENNMTKIITFISCIFFILSCAGTKSYLNKNFKKNISTLGIITFSGPQDLGEAVSDKFTMELLQKTAFNVIERRQIQQVLEEQGLSLSGIINDKERIQIGKITGIDAYITGSIIHYSSILTSGGDVELNIRMIDIETGGIIYSGSAKSDWILVATGSLSETTAAVISAVVKDMKKKFNK